MVTWRVWSQSAGVACVSPSQSYAAKCFSPPAPSCWDGSPAWCSACLACGSCWPESLKTQTHKGKLVPGFQRPSHNTRGHRLMILRNEASKKGTEQLAAVSLKTSASFIYQKVTVFMLFSNAHIGLVVNSNSMSSVCFCNLHLIINGDTNEHTFV